MIGRPFRIARIFGIPIQIDVSWIFIVVLLTSSLSLGLSRDFPYLGWAARIGLGFLGSILLFGSVLAHELSHSLVALRQHIPIRGITLFVFGGAAEMAEEPRNAGAELRVALAGPVMSLALAVGFGGLYTVALGRLPAPATWMMWFTAVTNGILVAFNLVPGFPLDGGRVLRAVLWGTWGDLHEATRVASKVGAAFGSLIMVLGFVRVFPLGDLVGGIWSVFIGLFLRLAARASYRNVFLRESLKSVRVRDLMVSNAVSVPPETSLTEVVHGVMLTSGLTEFPVVAGERLLGLVGLRDIRAVDRSLWGRVTAGEVMRRNFDRRALAPTDDVMRVFSVARSEDDVIPVVEAERLAGVISLRELMRHIRLRMELGATGLLAPGVDHRRHESEGEERGQEDRQEHQTHEESHAQEQEERDLQGEERQLQGRARKSAQEIERQSEEPQKELGGERQELECHHRQGEQQNDGDESQKEDFHGRRPPVS